MASPDVVDAAANRYVNVFTNYSFQAMPVAKNLPPGTSINDVNWPAKNRFNAGFDFSRSRFLGNMLVSFTDKAYWQDVLDVRYAGVTKAYTMVNGAVGVRWAHDKIVTSLKMNNIGNADVQQKYKFGIKWADQRARYNTGPNGMVTTVNGNAVQNNHGWLALTFKTSF